VGYFCSSSTLLRTQLKHRFLKSAGICGTDLHEYDMGPTFCPKTPHPVTNETVPITLGHELSAVVEEVGEGVTRFKPGDRVVLEPIISDGTCGACEDGHINCCSANGFVGISGYGGGFSEHMVLDEKYLWPLSPGISLEVGGKCDFPLILPVDLHGDLALVEPLSVAWRATEQGNLKPSDTVLILGGGPIGLAVLLCLQAQGLTRIIVTEIAAKRKALAKELGAQYVLDPTKEDVAARCVELFDGRGAHVAFDCAGVQAGLITAINGTRAKATIVNVAIWEKPASLPMNLLVFREKSIKGTAAPEHKDFLNVLKAISEGKLQPLGLVTKRIGLHEVEEEGFKTLLGDRASHAKILVKVGGG
jgi:threonine dehydrogenase-like Zn-dependent dehydrogenase